jgi:3-ketoacyl-CoA synthase
VCPAGIRGVRLGKELMSVAANGLKLNMTRLGPLVLPLSEQLLFAGNIIARMLLGPKRVKAYVPDFGLAFDHICLHTGEAASLSRARCAWQDSGLLPTLALSSAVVA